MVTVSGYKVRQNKAGESFIALELMGSLELLQSQNTGNFYATVRRCSIPSTFDETIAQMMVGSKMDGDVLRVPSDPYEYIVKRTGEVITLAYSYAYQPAGSKELIGEGRVTELQVPGSDKVETTAKPNGGIKAAAANARKRELAGK